MKICHKKIKYRPPPGQDPWNQAFREGDLPRRNEITIGIIIRKQDEYMKLARATGRIWFRRELRETIKRDLGFEEPVLRAPVEIAKGETPILAISRSQLQLLENFFDTDFFPPSRTPFYALLESATAEPREVEVLIKKVDVQPKTIDHLIISQGAAGQLGFDPGQERKDIRVLAVYQRIEEVDLDKL